MASLILGLAHITHFLMCVFWKLLQFKSLKMKGLMSRLLLSCEHASLLVLKKEENKISQVEKVQLWFHSSICGLCKEFDEQNDFINNNLEFHFNNQEGNIELSEEQKLKMKEALLEKE